MGFWRSLFSTRKHSARSWHRPPGLEELESRVTPTLALTVVGATGVPNAIMPVNLQFEGNGTSVLPFDHPTALRVAAGDFDGDGIVREFVVMGRARTQDANDLRAELVVYGFEADFQPPVQKNRFFVFDEGILGNGFVAAGDVDGDGDDDIVAAQIGGGRTVVTAQILLSNGDGTFAFGDSLEYDFGLISAPRIAAGDIDSDLMDELVIAARTEAGARTGQDWVSISGSSGERAFGS